MNILGIITARGGSKGVPNKNLELVAGKPLIAWTVATAIASRRLTRTIVSTDSQQIASAAQKHGGCVPFLRPPELAQDRTPHAPVIQHAINWVRTYDKFAPDYIVILQPTSPFRLPEDIDNAVEIAVTKKANSVISLCHSHRPPWWAKTISEDGRVFSLLPQTQQPGLRQEMPPAFMPNGAVYVVDVPYFMQTGVIVGDNSYAYLMPENRSLDIDTEWDLQLARLIMESNTLVK